MELRDYGKAFRRWWWLVVIAALLGGAAAYQSVRSDRPAYQAKTRLLVNRVQTPGLPSNDDLQASGSLAKTYTEMIHNPQILNEAVTRLNAPLTARTLDGKISADPVRDTRIIQISAEDTDPALAARISNTVAQVLVKQVQDLQSKTIQSSLQQVDSDIAAAQGQITDATNRLTTLRLQQTLTQNDQEQRDIRARIADASGRLAQLKAAPDPSSVTTDEIQRVQAQVDQLNQDLNNARQRYNDTTAQLDRLRSAPVPASLLSYDAQGVQDLLSQYNDRYRRLQDTRQSITIAQTQSLAALTITDPAAVPTTPQPSHRTQNVGLGALLGLLLAAGLAVMLSRFDDRIRSPRDISENLDVTTLATVPSTRRGTPCIVTDANSPTNELTEALHLLRTSLPRVPGPSAQVICVTSAGRGEGKSIVAANLAIVEAQANLRVVLIDANFRRPSLHTLFGLSNERGLSSLLMQEESDLEAVLESGLHGIKILPSGPRPLNPGALLDSPFMAALVYDLRNRADIIIIDAAPVLPEIDTLMLQQHTDGNIVVADIRRTGTRALGQALAAIEHVSGTVWGVVLNRVRRGQQPFVVGAEAATRGETFREGAPRMVAPSLYRLAEMDPRSAGEIRTQPVALNGSHHDDTTTVSRIAGGR